MADPLYVILTNQFRQQLADRANSATAEMARRWLAVEQALQADMLAMAEELTTELEAGRSISQTKLLRMERYQSLLLQVQGQIAGYNAVVAEPRITDDALLSAVQGLTDALSLIDVVVQPAGASVIEVVFDRLGVEAAENITALARAGAPLRAILERSYPAAVEGITNQLIRGVAQGINPRVVARRMVREGLSQGLNHILLVARDQQNRAYRQASLDQYKTSGVVTGYKRISAKQTRTCPACLALDGREYPLDAPFAEHPQGRCSRIPLVRGFTPPRFQTGETWFRAQPAAVQRGILGNGRYEAWRDGLFEFSDLARVVENETWGPSAQPRALKDLVPA